MACHEKMRRANCHVDDVTIRFLPSALALRRKPRGLVLTPHGTCQSSARNVHFVRRSWRVALHSISSFTRNHLFVLRGEEEHEKAKAEDDGRASQEDDHGRIGVLGKPRHVNHPGVDGDARRNQAEPRAHRLLCASLV